MATTNPVGQILVTSGNQAVLAAGSRISALKNGQIGVFNYHTGLSVDGSVPSDCQDIFIAVGINRTSGGTANMEDFNKSAGQMIQTKRLRNWTVKGYMAEVAKVVEVTGFRALSNTPYGLKIEYRNQKSYGINGYNPLVKTFNAQTSISPTGALAGDNGELADLLIQEINLDSDALVIASGFAYQISGTFGAASATASATIAVGAESFVVPVTNGDSGTTVAAKVASAINASSGSAYSASSVAAVIYVFPKVAAATGSTSSTISVSNANGTGVAISSVTAANASISNVTTFRAANPGVGIGIRITGTAEVRPSFNNDINIKYHKTGTDFLVSLPYGFEGIGSATVVTELGYVEGSGYDLKQYEYEVGGFNGKPGPYRQSSVTGLARSGFEYFINPSSNYNVAVVSYDVKSVAGWKDERTNTETLVAIPCADTTTLQGLATVLDAIFVQFGPMTNDVASMSCSNSRTGLLTPSTDGIEVVS